VRSKKDLGSIDVCKATLNPFEPLVYTRAPHPLPRLHLGVPSNCKAGSVVDLTLTSAESQPEGTVRVLRLEFIKPNEEPYELYAQNVMVQTLPHSTQIAIACNDPAGSWNVHAHDLMSGQMLQGSFTVDEAKPA
jgi:hypothetical protein